MDQLCGSKFWDMNVTWYTKDPDLTPCFQKTVLVWIPSIFPLIALPIAIMQLRTTFNIENKPLIKSLNIRNLARILISLLLVLIEIVILARHAVHFVDHLACGVRIFSNITISCLDPVLNNKTLRNQRLLTSFWLFSTICDFISFQSAIRIHLKMHILRNVNEFEVLTTARFVFLMLQATLNCFSDRSPKLSSGQVKALRTDSSIFSQLFFCWISPLILKGYRVPLKAKDLLELDSELTIENVETNIESLWIETADRNQRLLRTLVALCGHRYLTAISIISLVHVLDVASALTVSLLVNFATGTEETWKGYLYAFMLFLLPFVSEIATEYQLFIFTKLTISTKAALSCLIYKKSLCMSPAARGEHTIGKLLNFMSVDAQKVADIFLHLDKILTSPLRVLLATWLMWYFVGWASFVGVGLVIALVFMSYCVGKYDKVHIKDEMQAKDKRLSLLGSIIAGIKILKFNSWGETFERKVKEVRKIETKTMTKSAVIRGAVEFLWMGSQVWVVFAVLFTCVMTDGWECLDVSTIFVTLAVCGSMCQFMTKLPKSISAVFQANVCLDRLERFLQSEEQCNLKVSSIEHPWAIKIEQLTASWGQPTPVLRNMNLNVPQGSLVAVVGAVGTGKSSLLATIVNEIQNRTGNVEVKGSVGYCKQLPWIQNGTVRENVLFGLPYSSEKYQHVLKACGLTEDVDALPAGDCTEIGERGVNLSGGQNQRVALARAVYQDADVYLLDDPLSAVDARLGKEIFDNVIGPNGILCTKTRVMVTSGLNFLYHADTIVLFKQDGLAFQGSYDEFIKIQDASVQEVLKSGSNEVKAEQNQQCLGNTPRLNGDGHLVVEESLNAGDITWSTYLVYARSAGWKFVIPALAAMPLYQAFSLWGNACLKMMSDCHDASAAGCFYYLWMYLGLSLPQYITIIVFTVLIAMVTFEASTNLHSSMLNRLLKAPMWIFDTTPSGRIMNRFSGDIHILDNDLVLKFRNILVSAATMLTTIGVIAYTVPTFMVVCVPGAALFYLLQSLYSPCVRQIRRLESVSLSPIMSFFEETITGITTIRTHQQQDRFLREFLQRIDKHHRVLFCHFNCDRWFLTRMSALTGVIKLVATLLVVNFRDSISSGLVGLTITYTLNLTYHCGVLFRELCYLNTHFVPVERIKEYTKLPQEHDCELPSVLPSNWPTKGEVRFVNYETKYRPELDLALRRVDLLIYGGEKVGLVGRTGAGKSSLTLALFRILEAAEGRILIDGIDIATVPLHKLRSSLTIIPQSPILFVGTLRFNLDPFNEYSDEQIWKALEATHLKPFVLTCPGELEVEIAEDGSNLSVGQKQLVFVARAVLRNSKILVLDEATASIDPATDEFIQRTIKSAFKDSTVITIAHRLRTVLDYDRIAVVDQGSVLEFGSPQSLLANEGSLFSKMATSAGIFPESELYC